ncbi:hypothetical protein ISN45_At03g036220 [Arabidopsis thaliana x Arabidopsis arenosa]|uniref:Uncharacterized protein n=1 Tax=Arabidopsis thaliana x Arabidopsis arenosa TaxID=1240361 RepID=A0A8T2EX99_9BRAS|nr:hypothetical protein ISN45_At03g036220 [Arabidopsis thaliana x Arabidopsis arenosa]
MKEMGTIRSSHDWVATSKDDGVLRLQDDLNSDEDSVVAIQNAAWSSFLWVELVVVVKFLGSQFSIIDPLKAKISSGSSSQNSASSHPVSCSPRKMTCFAFLDQEVTSLDHGISTISARNHVAEFTVLKLSCADKD